MSTEWDAWLADSGWAELWPDGTDAVILDEVDSTMAEAARRAPVDRPTWILARRQTAGRGRRGRAWHQPEGNFAATYIFRPNRPPHEAALTSFAAALALYEVLHPWAKVWDRDLDLSLKWPNDVLLENRKVAGILLESASTGTKLDWLAVGIGINLTHAPTPDQVEEGAVPPICLADVTRYPHPLAEVGDHEMETVLVHLAASLALRLKLWDEFGFDVLRSEWISRHRHMGTTKITARLPNETIVGHFEDLDADGCLVLNTGQGLRRIAAADVYYG